MRRLVGTIALGAVFAIGYVAVMGGPGATYEVFGVVEASGWRIWGTAVGLLFGMSLIVAGIEGLSALPVTLGVAISALAGWWLLSSPPSTGGPLALDEAMFAVCTSTHSYLNEMNGEGYLNPMVTHAERAAEAASRNGLESMVRLTANLVTTTKELREAVESDAESQQVADLARRSRALAGTIQEATCE